MKYIKKFESFVTKELSNVYKAAIGNRFVTLDSVHDSSIDTEEETTIAPPITTPGTTPRPSRPFMPTEKPKVKEKPMGMMTYEEFRMGGEVETAPVTAPPTTTPGTTPRPFRPFMPTEKPKVKEKPMGTFEEVMSMFFSELNKIKDTSEGQKMLKNIETKYGNL